MAWITMYETDALTLVVDDEKQTAMLEVNSGGYRPRYITLHWNEQELAEVIKALQSAHQSLTRTSS
ncbi:MULTISPECIES: hypothetical protein [Paenibacillus]|uniref:Uncharacterized protein n=1 Tax=Paenibacillus radicis (ex Xue et al. 2023) TaxID=2972489 RepID=A0ABT1YKY0_9BACL|nr:hypothetical protein [Paenibacillus radicis (ex Xue et al. 2023)]MCR8633833.1 hypothetical protein [Paenibacillus radicis (ex Xue et al. 2023)]